MPRQPVLPDKVVERCGRKGNKRDLNSDAPSLTDKEYFMPKPIDFIQYRLAHVSYRRERWLAPTVGRINVLHNRRLRFDEHFVDDERGQAKRTYYKVVEPNAYFGKFCAHLNAMINFNRASGQPAIVLDFAEGKETAIQRGLASAENSMTSIEEK